MHGRRSLEAKSSYSSINEYLRSPEEAVPMESIQHALGKAASAAMASLVKTRLMRRCLVQSAKKPVASVRRRHFRTMKSLCSLACGGFTKLALLHTLTSGLRMMSALYVAKIGIYGKSHVPYIRRTIIGNKYQNGLWKSPWGFETSKSKFKNSTYFPRRFKAVSFYLEPSTASLKRLFSSWIWGQFGDVRQQCVFLCKLCFSSSGQERCGERSVWMRHWATHARSAQDISQKQIKCLLTR